MGGGENPSVAEMGVDGQVEGKALRMYAKESLL
jgi:hypothetical protein